MKIKDSIMIRKSYIIILIIVFLFIFIFRNNSDRKIYKNGTKKALTYIDDKYHIKPSVISTKLDSTCEISFCTSNDLTINGLIVNMKYKEKKFKVYLPMNDKREFSNPKDDFQLDKIKKAYVDYISQKIGVNPYDYELEFINDYGKENFMDDDNLFNSYYDINTNINDFVKKYDIIFTFKYINNINLEQLRGTDYIEKNMIGEFINFNSLEDYNRNKKIDNTKLSEVYLYGEPLFINDILIYDGRYDNFEYYLYSNIKNENIPFVVTDGEKYLKKENNFISENVAINKIDDYDIISPIYTINYSNSDNRNGLYSSYKLYVYVKKDKILSFSENELEKYKVYNVCDTETGKQSIEYSEIKEDDIVGDYIKVSSYNNKFGGSKKCEFSIVSKKELILY